MRTLAGEGSSLAPLPLPLKPWRLASQSSLLFPSKSVHEAKELALKAAEHPSLKAKSEEILKKSAAGSLPG